MRWSDACGALSPDEQERLVNLLTIGFGRLSHAAQLSSGNAPTAAVLGALAAAHDTLRGTQRLLAPAPAAAAEESPLDRTPVLRDLPWQDFLAGAPERLALVEALQTVVQQARQAGELILADGDAATVAQHLGAAEAGIRALRQTIVSGISA